MPCARIPQCAVRQWPWLRCVQRISVASTRRLAPPISRCARRVAAAATAAAVAGSAVNRHHARRRQLGARRNIAYAAQRVGQLGSGGRRANDWRLLSLWWRRLRRLRRVSRSRCGRSDGSGRCRAFGRVVPLTLHAKATAATTGAASAIGSSAWPVNWLTRPFLSARCCVDKSEDA